MDQYSFILFYYYFIFILLVEELHLNEYTVPSTNIGTLDKCEKRCLWK